MERQKLIETKTYIVTALVALVGGTLPARQVYTLDECIGQDTLDIDVAFHITDSLPLSSEALYQSPESSLSLTPGYNLSQAKLKATRINHKVSVGKNPTITMQVRVP